MFTTIINAFKNKSIRKKFLITILLILVFRIGCWIPVPGFDTSDLMSTDNTFLELLSSISGGALSNASILALGVSPYITSSIIVQLLGYSLPFMKNWSESGEEGRRKINATTKWVALVLAIAQAIGIVVANSSSISLNLLENTLPTWLACAFVCVVLVAGSMFTYWLGEKITEIGVANGLSMLIFVGILSTAGTALYTTIVAVFESGIEYLWNIIIFLLVLIAIFFVIVLMDMAERRITVQYAKSQRGNKTYGGQNSFIPVKVLGGGVMPIIFASSIIIFPQMLMSIFWPTSDAYYWYSSVFGLKSVWYSIVLGILVILFAFFYQAYAFNTEDIAKNLQKNGGFVEGIRPGVATQNYLAGISRKITFIGAFFLAFMAIIPSIIFTQVGGTVFSNTLTNGFTATGMLVVVSVALEFNRQLETTVASKSYKGFLK